MAMTFRDLLENLRAAGERPRYGTLAAPIYRLTIPPAGVVILISARPGSSGHSRGS